MVANSPGRESVWKNIERYAMVGLRTLLLADRVIAKEEYEEWNEKYCKACTAL